MGRVDIGAHRSINVQNSQTIEHSQTEAKPAKLEKEVSAPLTRAEMRRINRKVTIPPGTNIKIESQESSKPKRPGSPSPSQRNMETKSLAPSQASSVPGNSPPVASSKSNTPLAQDNISQVYSNKTEQKELKNATNLTNLSIANLFRSASLKVLDPKQKSTLNSEKSIPDQFSPNNDKANKTSSPPEETKVTPKEIPDSSESVPMEALSKGKIIENATKKVNDLQVEIDNVPKSSPPLTLKELKSLTDKLMTLSKEYDPSVSPNSHIDHLVACGKKINALLPPPKEKSAERTAIRNDIINMGTELTIKRFNHGLEGFIEFSNQNMEHMGTLFDEFSSKPAEGSTASPTLKTPDGLPLPKSVFEDSRKAAINNLEENKKSLSSEDGLTGKIAKLLPPNAPNVIPLMVTCANSLCEKLKANNDPNLSIAEKQLEILKSNTAEGKARNYPEVSAAVAKLAELTKSLPASV